MMEQEREFEAEHDWRVTRESQALDLKGAGMGAIRFALLFGLCGIALALLCSPSLRGGNNDFSAANAGVDPMRVASTPR